MADEQALTLRGLLGGLWPFRPVRWRLPVSDHWPFAVTIPRSLRSCRLLTPVCDPIPIFVVSVGQRPLSECGPLGPRSRDGVKALVV